MNPTDAIEHLIKLALRRHDDGLPNLILYFDRDGKEVSSKTVGQASPKGKQGELETYTPKPGVGYFGHVRLADSSTEAATGEKHRFEIATPTMELTSTYVQPWKGAAHFLRSIQIRTVSTS